MAQSSNPRQVAANNAAKAYKDSAINNWEARRRAQEAFTNQATKVAKQYSISQDNQQQIDNQKALNAQREKIAKRTGVWPNGATN